MTTASPRQVLVARLADLVREAARAGDFRAARLALDTLENLTMERDAGAIEGAAQVVDLASRRKPGSR